MKKYKHVSTFTYNNKRYYIYADTLEEIGRKKAKKKYELENGLIIPNHNTKVKDWTEKAIDLYKQNQSDITRAKFVKRIDHCILQYIGDMKISSVTLSKLQEVMNLQKGRSPTQVKEVYNAIKFIFSSAYKNDLINKDISENLVMPQTAQIRSRRALTPKERAVFIDVGFSQDKYLPFMFMLLCGCRPSEACHIRFEDITIIDGYKVLHIKGTKNQRSDRFVPCDDRLYDKRFKIDYIKDLRPLWRSFKRDINIALGCKTYRNKLVPPLPLAEDLYPYCLRHEYCTNLARQGVDIRIAQQFMGHSDISLTANIYTNFTNTETIKRVQQQVQHMIDAK